LTEYCCELTGKKFESENELYDYYRENLHLVLLDVKDGKYYCTFCKKYFLTPEAYHKHFYDSQRHIDRAYNKLFLGMTNERLRKKKNYECRPAEKALIEFKLRTDPKKKPFRYRILKNEIILDEMKYAVTHRSWLNLCILGIPGSGKSILALTLAKIHLDLYKQYHPECMKSDNPPDIFITHNYSQSKRVASLAAPGSIIVQDEAPLLHGAGSRIELEALRNIMKIARAQMVSFYFCSPVEITEAITPNLVLETYEMNRAERITTGFIYTRMQTPIGMFAVKVLDEDDPLLLDYEEVKMANLKDVLQSTGLVAVESNEDEVNKCVPKVVEKYLKFYPLVEKPKIEDIYSVFPFAKVRGDKYFRRVVAKQAAAVIAARAIDKQREELAEDIKKMQEEDEEMDAKRLEDQGVLSGDLANMKIKYTKYEEIIDNKLYKYLEAAIPFVKSRRIQRGEAPSVLFKMKHLKAYLLRMRDSLSWSQVLNEFPEIKSIRTFTLPYEKYGWIAILKKEILGEAYEVALSMTYLKPPEWIHKGGPGEPDFEKADGSVVIEVKAKERLNRSIDSFITGYERKALLEGKRVELWHIEPHKGFCRLKKYLIEIEKNKLEDRGDD